MIQLVRYADVVVPNVTEACILTGTPYKERWTTRELAKMAEQIVQTGPEKVVITEFHRKRMYPTCAMKKRQRMRDDPYT